jgi:diguanylate cyclase (GGDEF)-like protein/PAS domain S-box-containing protein
MHILSRLWPRLEKVHASLTDPELRRQSLLLARLLLVVVLLGGLFVIIQSVLAPGFRQMLLVLDPALGLLVLAMALNHRGWYRTAGMIAVSVVLAGCFGVLFINPQDVLVYAYLVVPLFLARLFLPGFLFITMPVVIIAGVLGVSWLLGSSHMQAILGSVFLAIMTLLFGIARQHRLAIEHDRRAALAVSERELRTILNNMQDTYYRTDQDGRIVRASESATQLLGYTPDEVLGMRLADFYVDADGRERFQGALQAASGTLRNYEAALRHRDGSVIWVSTNAQYVRAADGRVIGIEGTTRDITDRKYAEQALRDSETYLRAVISNAPVVLYTLDPDGVFRLSEGRGLAALQLKPGEAVGRSVFDLYRDYPEICAATRRALAGEAIVYVTRLGSQTFETHNTPTFDTDGRVKTVIGLAVDITERLRAEQALVQSESNYRTLTENANVGIMVNHRGKHVFANNRLLDMLGYTADEMRETGVKELVHPLEYDKVTERFRDRMNGEPAPGVYETVFVTKAGEAVPVELTATRTTWQGEPAGLVMLQDIRERLRSDTQMRKLSSALEQTADSVIITDRNGIIEYVNLGFEKTTGYSRDEAVGQTPGLLKSGKQGAGFYKKLWGTILAGEVFNEVFVNRRKDGSLYYEEKTITPLKDATGQIINFVATGKDVTERMQTQERLEHMAQHDALTELPNRLLFMDRLKQALARARWHERLVAVLFVDLDRFKTINDTLGHETGDRLLQVLAGRLAASVREGDTVARFGGDEFAMLLDDVASEKDVGAVAQKVIEMLAPPFEIDGQNLYITASIGVSLYPNDGEDSTTLIKNADIAMYRAKDLGKNTYQFYSADMSARAFERLTLESSLRHAIERNEFRLYYQPQIDTASGAILGVEALLRWQHPDFGLVAPAEFIPLLEETGLIVPVGDWVFRTACEQLCAWHAAGWPRLRMAVNLSPRQFQVAGLAIMVERDLAAVGCDPDLIELEITENILLRHAADTLATLDALRALGVRLSIDDFGTGYSSLSYLRRYAIDTLKIDRSFVHDVPDDADGSAITSAIVSLAQNLKLDVIAEGVETEAQRDFLRERGCHVMQGYLFSRPLPAEEIPRLLATRNPKG